MSGGAKRPWKLFLWPRVGVVDVGSNAIRVTIAEVSSAEIRPIETHRFSLRLGKDVFNNGRTISLESQANLIDIFNQIKKIFLEHKVDLYRAVATAALRSARNRKRVLSRVLRNTGIQIELISAEEEGRLIGASLPKRHFARRELLMDLGGGSLELAYYENSQLKGVTTLPLGAVRLLSKGQSVHALCDHIATVSEKDSFLWKFIQHTPKNLYVVGSGGNIRALYRLRKRILHKELSKNPILSVKDLTTIIQRLEKKSPKEREKDFKLAKDRADVIVPAGYVFHQMLHYLGVQEIHVPFSVSLRQGTLIDLQRDLYS